MYAYIDNDSIVELFNSKPEGYNLVGFPPNCPDEVYAQYGIYPVTMANEPNNDGYHTNELAYSVVDGLPVGTYTTTDVLDDQWIVNLVNAVQRRLDGTASQRNYDGIMSLCTYATSTNPKFSAEGQAGVAWRDAVWAKCYEVLGQYQSGAIDKPTEQELLDQLPPFTWPGV